LKVKSVLSVTDLSASEISSIVEETVAMKTRGRLSLLEGKTLAIMFEKPSLRTRVSFEMAMRQLGGQTIYLSPAEVGLGQRESIPDVARVLSRFVDAITCRTFAHKTLEVMAEYATIPVINALSDFEHPCQALADLVTIREKKGTLAGVTVAYVGDGNNVAISLMLAVVMTGGNFRIASPSGYTMPDAVVQSAKGYAQEKGGSVFCTEAPEEAVKNADVVYTDVWTSMGQESESEQRRKIFSSYQVNERLLSLAKKDAIFMHPLPAHHGEEVAEGIVDSPQSVVFDQAENRMHAQKALLVKILGTL